MELLAICLLVIHYIIYPKDMLGDIPESCNSIIRFIDDQFDKIFRL